MFEIIEKIGEDNLVALIKEYKGQFIKMRKISNGEVNNISLCNHSCKLASDRILIYDNEILLHSIQEIFYSQSIGEDCNIYDFITITYSDLILCIDLKLDTKIARS